MDSSHISVRHLTRHDMDELRAACTEVYQQKALDTWSPEVVDTLLTRFPEGQICVCVDNKVVGCAFSLIIDYSRFGDHHTYKQITDNMR